MGDQVAWSMIEIAETTTPKEFDILGVMTSGSVRWPNNLILRKRMNLSECQQLINVTI